MADRRAAAKKAARTKRLRAAGNKAARTRRLKAAGKKAVLTKKRRAAARKAAATRKLKQEQSASGAMAATPSSPETQPTAGKDAIQQ